MRVKSLDAGATITIEGGRQTGKSYAAMKMAIDAAVLGERVLYDCDSHPMMRERFDQMRQLAPADQVAKVYLATGNEQIRFRSGGEIIMICRTARGGRGFTTDVHVIDHDRPGAKANFTAKRVIRTRLTGVLRPSGSSASVGSV